MIDRVRQAWNRLPTVTVGYTSAAVFGGLALYHAGLAVGAASAGGHDSVVWFPAVLAAVFAVPAVVFGVLTTALARGTAKRRSR